MKIKLTSDQPLDDDGMPNTYIDDKNNNQNKKKARPFTSVPRKPLPFCEEERSF